MRILIGGRCRYICSTIITSSAWQGNCTAYRRQFLISRFMAGTESLDEDFNIDVALQQYLNDIEQCTSDLPQTPPSLHDLSSLTNSQPPTSLADAGFYDALFPKPTSSYTVPSDGLGQTGLPEQEAECIKEPSASSCVRRTEAWAAKNRRAQKRFRERQKVVQQSWHHGQY